MRLLPEDRLTHLRTPRRGRGELQRPTRRPRTDPARSRRLPRRRPAALLLALVAGGLAAAVNLSGPPTAVDPELVQGAREALRSADGRLESRSNAEITEAQAQARLREITASRAARGEAAAAAAEAARPKAVFPIRGAQLTSAVGPRWGTTHRGIDLAAPMLTPEYAAVDGVVLRAGPASGFGQAVYLLTSNGDVLVYGHMERIRVRAGQFVPAGTTVALVGNRGQSTGPHLHFEVRSGGATGSPLDPLIWLRQRGVDTTTAI